MSGPADVLAVMDKAWAATPGDAITLRVEIDDARAAVAELIEAGRGMMRQDAVQRATHNTNPFMADAADKLMAALEKVGAK